MSAWGNKDDVASPGTVAVSVRTLSFKPLYIRYGDQCCNTR